MHKIKWTKLRRVLFMNFSVIVDKTKDLCRKVGIKTLIAVGAVLVIGGVVTLNFVLKNGVDESTSGKMAIDLSSGAGTSDSAQSTTLTADEVTDYFAAISLQRQQARDEAMEVLASVAGNESALEEAKQAALDDMNRLALDIEKEANIETLVQSKGFEQCVAVISGDKCNVIVESSGLLPGEAAQISEIVYEQAGIIPENLKIIEKNAG